MKMVATPLSVRKERIRPVRDHRRRHAVPLMPVDWRRYRCPRARQPVRSQPSTWIIRVLWLRATATGPAAGTSTGRTSGATAAIAVVVSDAHRDASDLIARWDAKVRPHVGRRNDFSGSDGLAPPCGGPVEYRGGGSSFARKLGGDDDKVLLALIVVCGRISPTPLDRSDLSVRSITDITRRRTPCGRAHGQRKLIRVRSQSGTLHPIDECRGLVLGQPPAGHDGVGGGASTRPRRSSTLR